MQSHCILILLSYLPLRYFKYERHQCKVSVFQASLTQSHFSVLSMNITNANALLSISSMNNITNMQSHCILSMHGNITVHQE